MKKNLQLALALMLGLATTVSAQDWSVNSSFNADYTFGPGNAASFGVHTANATTNIMSFASVTAGRMALNFGSGRIIGSNDWNNDGNTWDGMMFGINNDFADIHVGYASANMEGAAEDDFKLLQGTAATSRLIIGLFFKKHK